jgi:hypothetical protein
VVASEIKYDTANKSDPEWKRAAADIIKITKELSAIQAEMPTKFASSMRFEQLTKNAS